jgi:hypothetical protein
MQQAPQATCRAITRIFSPTYGLSIKINGRVVFADGLEVVGQMEQELRVTALGIEYVGLVQVIAHLLWPPSQLVQHAHGVVQ